MKLEENRAPDPKEESMAGDRQEIMAALAKLPPERRQVFIDAAIDGKSYQQLSLIHI